MPDDDLYVAYLDGLRTRTCGQQELDAARHSAEQRANARREDSVKKKWAAEDAVYRSRKARLRGRSDPDSLARDLANRFRRLCKDVGVAVPSEFSSYEEAARAAYSRAFSDELFDRIRLADERIRDLDRRWSASQGRRRRLGLPAANDTDE